MYFFFVGDGDHLDLHVLTHSFPTRRSSELHGMEGVRLRIRRTRPDDESELRDVVTSRREVVAGFRTLARDTAAHPGLIAHWFGLGAESAQADVRWAKACKDRKSTRLNSSH